MKDQDRITKEKDLVKENEVDLIEIIKTLWGDRRRIIKTVIIFSFLGLMVALFSEKEYAASTIMVPQIDNQSSNLGGLSSLASLAGFNMDMNTGGDAISPMLYPKIISSVSFQLEIMNAEYKFEEMEDSVSMLVYYDDIYKPRLFGVLKKYTIGLPGVIKSAMEKGQEKGESDSKPETIRLTLAQDKVRKILEKNLSLVVNDQEGYLKLESRFHQASLSAQVAKISQMLLQEYITQFKVEKAKSQLDFIRERYEENKSEFDEAQAKLAAFRDANKNISSEIMRTQEEQLQNEYQLAFDVYSELAKQLEQALIKVEENTPVFSVIKKVVVPIEKSKPKRLIILIISMFLGVVVGAGIVIGISYFSRWDENELHAKSMHLDHSN